MTSGTTRRGSRRGARGGRCGPVEVRDIPDRVGGGERSGGQVCWKRWVELEQTRRVLTTALCCEDPDDPRTPGPGGCRLLWLAARGAIATRGQAVLCHASAARPVRGPSDVV